MTTKKEMTERYNYMLKVIEGKGRIKKTELRKKLEKKFGYISDRNYHEYFTSIHIRPWIIIHKGKSKTHGDEVSMKSLKFHKKLLKDYNAFKKSVLKLYK